MSNLQDSNIPFLSKEVIQLYFLQHFSNVHVHLSIFSSVHAHLFTIRYSEYIGISDHIL